MYVHKIEMCANNFLQAIINHSLEEREYRGLQECYDHMERFMRYFQRMSSKPGFMVPENVSARQKAYAEKMSFVKAQMDDIRKGDGGRDRRRRAALREQLAPAFDDRNGSEGNRNTRPVDSNCSSNGSQTSAEPPVPFPTMDWSLSSPCVSPGAIISPPANHHPNKPLSLNQRSQQAHTRPVSQTGQSTTSSMPPPPSPMQGIQRPKPPAPKLGTVAFPYEHAPLPFLPKSVYHGLTQPYHNMALVIDSPEWTSTGTIGVLRFGYEPEWANGENIQRSGACLETASLTKGTGRRWLGDALVECFVGNDDGNGGLQEGEWRKDGDYGVEGLRWPEYKAEVDKDAEGYFGSSAESSGSLG
jgi:hypothetical protein